MVKNLPAMQMTQVQSAGWEDSLENGNPFQYSCLKNFMDRGAWRATVHGGRNELHTTEHARMHSKYLQLSEDICQSHGRWCERTMWSYVCKS